MTLTLILTETPTGDVELKMTGSETKSRKEHCYARNIVDLLKRELPKLNKALGGTGAVDILNRG